MFNTISTLLRRNVSRQIIRYYAGGAGKPNKVKVTICGAAGQVGQPLALMLKNCSLIDELALYDLASTTGIASELSHVDTNCKVKAYKGKLPEALQHAQIVVICASAKRSCSADALFKPNAVIMFDIMTACARSCPKAMIVIGTEPINSMVPLASEVLKKYRVYNPNHVFGATTIDVVRANTFVADCQGLHAENVHVPVIGGHSKGTIVPVLSRCIPGCEFTNDELQKITEWVNYATEDVIQEKKCKGPYLCGAFALSRFVISLTKALHGQQNVVECCYVHSKLYPNLNYMTTPVVLGLGGIQKNLGIPKLSEYEQCLLQNAVNLIHEDIKAGEAFVGVKTNKLAEVEKKRCAADPCK